MEIINTQSGVRPDYGEQQIRDLEQIKPGMVVKFFFGSEQEFEELLLVLEEPYVDRVENGEEVMKFLVTEWPNPEGIKSKYCSDTGVTKYQWGKWSKSYLLRTDEVVSTDQVNSYLKLFSETDKFNI